MDDYEIRPLETWAEYREAVAVQRDVWGDDFLEIVPAGILKIARRVGGVASGAFTESGGLAGFVFGLTGLEEGGPVHWSHMLAVRESHRGQGLGRRLKEHQRSLVLQRGAGKMYWTFDPLVARNAHFNLNKLGARVVDYVEQMYGDTESELHRGLGTDRFVVAWELESYEPGSEPSADAPPEPTDTARVEVPADIHAVREQSLEEARRWREETRRAFQRYLGEGYRVAGFRRSGATGRPAYLLARD